MRGFTREIILFFNAVVSIVMAKIFPFGQSKLFRYSRNPLGSAFSDRGHKSERIQIIYSKLVQFKRILHFFWK